MARHGDHETAAEVAADFRRKLGQGVDIQDSKLVDAEVASDLGVDHACVRAALVGRTFFRSKLDAALVLDVGWRD